jgi:hypothetical protein
MQGKHDALVSSGQGFTWKHMSPSVPVQLCVVYLGILSVHALLAWRIKELLIVVYAALLVLLPRLVFRSLRIKVPVLLESGIALLVLATLIFGELSRLYDRVWWWDLPLHAGTGFVVSYIAFMVLKELFIERRPRYMRLVAALLAVSVSLGVSGGWEIYEFTVDHILGTFMQPDGRDTMLDLVAGLAGAVSSTVFFSRRDDFILRSFSTDYHSLGRRISDLARTP